MIEYRTDTQEFQRSATLIIAAEERLRRQFITIFNDTQFFVLEAPTLNELQDLARSARPDLILLAHGGVPFDSYAACAALHAETETHRVPIVLLIPGEDEVLINRALESGASDYISYPIKSNVMRQRVRFLLRMRHMQADLLEKEERYRIISTSISDYAYAFGVEPDGTLVKLWSTQAFETITGYNELDLDARGGWIALIHPDDIPIAIRRAERLMRGEKDVSEFRIVTRSGETRWLQDTGMPIWDEKQGRVTAIYGAAQDITDRKRAEEMMRNQAEQLRLRNEELDAFAHTVAHNLKNPIAGMMGTASLALNYYDRMTDAERRDNLEAIIEGAYKARDIIDSILLLAGVNRRSTVEIGPLEMREVIESVCDRLQPMIHEMNATITVPDTLPAAVGYAPWVEEVWANYLSNALKYGGVPPVVEFGADEPNEGQVRYWITDNGPGLTDEERAQVFTPFIRLNQVKVEGHGLGLSVVHRIVQRLGGTVGVDSLDGHGSRFWFTLPQQLRF
ncbi:MAG: PAS domain S-box protein [Chloroflexi bacterium]|nr:Sensor histidine kinase TmoS [Anaerolineae bacterium]MCC6564125.1 PAS domain S-box protein [Chloroflexota bacterium]MDL1915768.1 PAS domain S-box protein [Anaerolineae bacterium CFX4]MEB2366370.1 ATP-binding protein [Chloroflexota bacterium]RIK21469.1 MAG: hypothetical protein DCC53_07140 [Chloroflexota bacterium]